MGKSYQWLSALKLIIFNLGFLVSFFNEFSMKIKQLSSYISIQRWRILILICCFYYSFQTTWIQINMETKRSCQWKAYLCTLVNFWLTFLKNLLENKTSIHLYCIDINANHYNSTIRFHEILHLAYLPSNKFLVWFEANKKHFFR